MGNFNRVSKAFDDVFLFNRGATAFYHAADGSLQQVTGNEPRFLDNGGILLENSVTNFCGHNRDLNGASWSTSGTGTLTQNLTGVDGQANTAWTIEDTDAAATFSVYQDETVSDNTDNNPVSLYIKKTIDADTFPAVAVNYTGGSTSILAAWTINTDTGQATRWASDTDDGTIEIESRGDWWRIKMNVANNGTGHTALRLYIYAAVNTDGGATWDATATGSCGYDFAQIEKNTRQASLPLETTGSAPGTFTGEWLQVYPITDFAILDKWTIYGSLRDLVPATSGDTDLLSLDANDDDKMRVYLDSDGTTVYFTLNADGYGVTTITFTGITDRDLKVAASWNESTSLLTVALNGETKTAYHQGTSFAATAFRFCRTNLTNSRPDSVVVLEGKYYPIDKQANELAAMTA